MLNILDNFIFKAFITNITKKQKVLKNESKFWVIVSLKKLPTRALISDRKMFEIVNPLIDQKLQIILRRQNLVTLCLNIPLIYSFISSPQKIILVTSNLKFIIRIFNPEKNFCALSLQESFYFSNLFSSSPIPLPQFASKELESKTKFWTIIRSNDECSQRGS